MTETGHDSWSGSQKAATEMIIRAPIKQNVVRCGAGTASHVQQPKVQKVFDQVSTYFTPQPHGVIGVIAVIIVRGAIDHGMQRQKAKSRLVSEEAALGFYSRPWP